MDELSIFLNSEKWFSEKWVENVERESINKGMEMH